MSIDTEAPVHVKENAAVHLWALLAAAVLLAVRWLAVPRLARELGPGTADPLAYLWAAVWFLLIIGWMFLALRNMPRPRRHARFFRMLVAALIVLDLLVLLVAAWDLADALRGGGGAPDDDAAPAVVAALTPRPSGTPGAPLSPASRAT